MPKVIRNKDAEAWNKYRRRSARLLKNNADQPAYDSSMTRALLGNGTPSQMAFQHSPLEDASRQIRLLRFLPRQDEHWNTCELTSWNLEAAPQYAAISYVWGSPEREQDILLSGQRFHIHKNAHYALEQVAAKRQRWLALFEHFWIDSVCINQQDLEEKGLQVQLMADIFERAQRVLACVGPHAHDSSFLFDVLQEANGAKYCATYPSGSRLASGATYGRRADRQVEERILSSLGQILQRKPLSGSEPVPEQHFPPTISRFAEALKAFCNREYWKRLWIVQEVWLSRALYFLCGTAILETDDLAGIVFTATPPDLPGLSSFDDLLQRSLVHIQASMMHRALLNSRHDPIDSRYQGRSSLPPDLAFTSFRKCLCSNFRDRIYAVLPLVDYLLEQGDIDAGRSRPFQGIRPDYEITKLGLIFQVAQCLSTTPCGAIRGLPAISSLWLSLELSTRDEEVAELLESRGYTTKFPQERGRDASPSVVFDGLALTPCQLEQSDREGFEVRGPTSRNLKESPRNVTGSEGFVRVTHKDVIVGFVNRSARPGDYLFPLSHFASRQHGYQCDLCLVLRLCPDSSNVLDLVGYALIQPGSPYPDKSEYPACCNPPNIFLRRIVLDVEDFVVLVGLWAHTHYSRWPNLTLDISPVLNTRPTRERLSSHAMLIQ